MESVLILDKSYVFHSVMTSYNKEHNFYFHLNVLEFIPLPNIILDSKNQT